MLFIKYCFYPTVGNSAGKAVITRLCLTSIKSTWAHAGQVLSLSLLPVLRTTTAILRHPKDTAVEEHDETEIHVSAFYPTIKWWYTLFFVMVSVVLIDCSTVLLFVSLCVCVCLRVASPSLSWSPALLFSAHLPFVSLISPVFAPLLFSCLFPWSLHLHCAALFAEW